MLALFLHSEFYRVRIAYDSVVITVYSRWGGSRTIYWHEIRSIAFSKFDQNYVVQLHHGKKFTFSYLMCGYGSFYTDLYQQIETGPSN